MGGEGPQVGHGPPVPAADEPGDAVEREAGRIARARRSMDEAEQRARESFEQARSRYVAVQLASEAFERDRARAGGLLAGGLAYRVFLWVIPFLLFLISALGMATELAGSDPADVAHDVGMAAALSSTIAQSVADSEQGRWWFLVLGASVTIWAGRGMYRGFRLVSELAWGERAPQISAFKASLIVSGFAIAIIALQSLLPWLSDVLGLPGLLHFLFGLALAVGIVSWGLLLLPHGAAPWTAVIPGAILLAVGLRLLSLAASTYFAYRLDSAQDLYGSIGIAIVMMLYLFLLARLFVGAQFLNATLHRRRAHEQLGRWAASTVLGEGKDGGDHHPESGPTDDVVRQVRPDVHPAEPDRTDHAPEERAGPAG